MKHSAMSIVGLNKGTRDVSNSDRSEEEGRNPRNRNRGDSMLKWSGVHPLNPPQALRARARAR